MTAPRHVFYISDRTGLTAENIGEALLNQFGRIEFKRHTYPFIDTPEKARTVVEIVNRNAQENGLRPIAFVSVVNGIGERFALYEDGRSGRGING